MDLDFSEEQQMLRDTLRSLCAEHSTIEVVRAVEDDAKGYTDEFWGKLAELGITGLTLPEPWGAGMGLMDAVVVYEEFGRALAASPHFDSCVMAGGVLAAAGSQEQKDEWLPGIASGEKIVVPAWLEPGNGCGPRGVQMRARAQDDGFVLEGEKLHVHFAREADALLVLARSGDGDEDVDIFIVDAHAEGLQMEQQLSMASDCQYLLTFDGVQVDASARIGTAGSGWASWNTAMLDGIVLQAAQAMGGAERGLEITVQYSLDREQFGKPLGAFQALSHYMADATTLISGGRTLAYEAAWTRDQGMSTARLAPMAKLFACNTYRDATAMMVQVHGGMGFTIEYDIQLFFRRAKQMQLAWWDTRYLEDLVAADVLDAA